MKLILKKKKKKKRVEEEQKTSQAANQLGNGPLMLTYNPVANVMPMNMGMPQVVNNAFPLNVPPMNMMGNNLQAFPNMGGGGGYF